MRPFALIALALALAGAGACGGGKKAKTTPAGTGGGSGAGGGSDAKGMDDQDPNGAGSGSGDGSGSGAGSGDVTLPTGTGSDDGSGDGSGSAAADEDKPPPAITPPNYDISPEQAKSEVTRRLNNARTMLAANPPDSDGAIREAQLALAADGTSIDAIVTIAHANYHKRLYDTAEVILDDLYKHRSTSLSNPYLYYVYGLVYDKLGEDQKAFLSFRKATELDSNYASALIDLGVHQLANKQYPDATKTYERLTGDLGRNDAPSWNGLGSAYRGQAADYDPGSADRAQWLGKAEGAFKRAQGADRNYGPAYYNLGLLYLDADPFPGPGGQPLDTLVRLNMAKTYFDEYKNLPGVDMSLYDERAKDVTKLIKREEKKRKKATAGG